MRWLFGGMLVLALGVVGCSDSEGVDCGLCNFPAVCEPTHPLTDYPCTWVEAFCGTHDETVAVAMESPWSCQWTAGLCGDYRCLHHEYYVAQTLFYDSSGALIAVHMCEDTGCAPCCVMCERYGPVPREAIGEPYAHYPGYEMESPVKLCESTPPQ